MTTNSPIEDSLVSALLYVAPRLGVKLYLFHGYRGINETPDHHEDDQVVEPEVEQTAEMVVFRQAFVQGYRLDLLVAIRMSTVIGFAVECDGHEFHERTKQQAAYDRARDRDLLKGGVPTVRYTGSEIHRDAAQCATNIIEIARSLHDLTLSRAKDDAQAYANSVIEQVASDLEKETPGTTTEAP